MKSINKFALLFATAGILTSCSNEETLVKNSDNSGRTIHMVVTALRDGGQEGESRTTLEEDGSGNLAFKWSENDQILVTDADGVKKGFLKLKAGAGSNSGTFEGDLRGLDNGSVRLNYYYLGLQNSREGYTNVKGGESYTADYSSQLGTLESLSDYDMLSDFKNTLIQGDYSYSEFIDLKRRISFARFLMNLPEGAEAPYKVTMSSPKLGNKATIQLTDADAPLAKMVYEQGNIVLENLSSNDFYITYIPTDGQHEITFEVEDKNGVEYAGSYTMIINVGQSQYLRRPNDQGGYQGIPIDMNKIEKDNWYTFMYFNNLEGGVPEQHNELKAGKQYDKPVLSFNEIFPSVTIDPNRYEFSHWSYKQGDSSLEFALGNTHHFDFDDPSTGNTMVTTDGVPMIWTSLYACWKYIYTMEFELEDDVVVTGTETLNRTYKTYDIEWNPTIIEEGVTVSKEGYTLKGWDTIRVNDEEAHGQNVYHNKAYLSKYLWKKTFKPIWEKLPNTVETGGYKPGTLN